MRYFIGVCEAGSLLRAAARLHVAQPALGQQIAALEREVGARLFDRSSRGMAPTEAGKAFLEHARVVIADVERARAAVRESSEIPRGEVVVGLPTTVALAVTLPILRACRERYPQVRPKIVEAYSGFLREWLLGGRLDIALLYGDGSEAGLAKRPLIDEDLALVTAATGRRAPRRVGLRALAGRPIVLPGPEHGLRRIVDEACAEAGIDLDVVAEIESLPSVKQAVEAGIGATVLPLGSVAGETAAGRLRASIIDSPGMSRRVVCATSVTRPSTPASDAAIGLVCGVVREMVVGGAWPARWIGADQEHAGLRPGAQQTSVGVRPGAQPTSAGARTGAN